MSDQPGYNSSPFYPAVHQEPAKTSTGNGLDQNTQSGLRGKLIESIMQLVVQALTGSFIPGPLGSAFTQLAEWGTTLPFLGPIIQFIADLLGIDVGDVDPTTADMPSIWGNVATIFINPLGFFANLISGLIPGSQVPGLDATKITSGNFAQSIVTGLTGDIGNALGWLAGFVNGFTGQTYTAADVQAGNLTASDAATTAAQAAEALLANSIAVAQLTADQDGTTNSGLASSDDFERIATTDINGASGVGYWAITLAASAATAGTYTIADGHTAKFIPGSGGGNQTCLYRRTKTDDALTSTLYQKVGGVIGAFTGDPSFFSGAANLRLRARLNTAETQEVFCNIDTDGNAQFGYRNGSTTDVLITGVGAIVNVGAAVPGTTWYLIAGTAGGVRKFQLMKNRGVVHAWDDSGALSAATIVTNCGWGWGGFAATAGSASKHPPDVGIVSIADNTPATVLGSILQVRRFSTTPVSASTGAIPNNYFDDIELGSADIAWSATNSEATVSKTGVYQVGFSLQDTASMTGGQHTHAMLYVNGSPVKAGATVFSGSGVTSFGPYQLFYGAPIYLNAGDVVKAGLDTNAGARSLLGDATGAFSWFSIGKVG